jgi:hypothetical protein
MSPDKEQVPQPRIDISACLDAVNMYDAAYHRDRVAYDHARNTSVIVYQEPEPSEPPILVSWWQYVWGTGVKTGAGLLGTGLFLATLLAALMIVVLFFVNVLHDLSPVEKDPYTSTQNTQTVSKADGSNASTANGSDVPPTDWAEVNRRTYDILLTILVLSPIGSMVCLQRAGRIKPMVPISYANTAHLPAHESLVRASQEPRQESLVRASSQPPTPSGMLLRSLVKGRETSPEQLVRPTTGEAKE